MVVAVVAVVVIVVANRAKTILLWTLDSRDKKARNGAKIIEFTIHRDPEDEIISGTHHHHNHLNTRGARNYDELLRRKKCLILDRKPLETKKWLWTVRSKMCD